MNSSKDRASALGDGVSNRLFGQGQVWHYRNGVLQPKSSGMFRNAITDQGHASFISWFTGATGPSQMWMGLINGNPATPSLDADETYQDITDATAAYTEFLDYDVSATSNVRAEWIEGAVAPGPPATIDNASSVATFDITGTPTNDVFGIFLVYNLTTPGAPESHTDPDTGDLGILWAHAAFAAEIPVSSGDQIKVTYTISC